YALGVPVITTDVGGLAETVAAGETGLIVRPEDPEALARAIVRFFAEGLATSLRAGVERLRAAHSWEALAGSTLELIDTLRPARGWKGATGIPRPERRVPPTASRPRWAWVWRAMSPPALRAARR